VNAAGTAQLSLHFVRAAGGRTVLAQRSVRYPHHITAPLAGRHDAVLVVQSASGGLYGGEQLKQLVLLGAGAQVELRFPSATVVHAVRQQQAVQQSVVLQVGEGAALHHLQRPLILLPGARLMQSLHASVERGGRLLWCEGVTLHDPGSPEARLAAPPSGPAAARSIDSRLTVTDAAGRRRVIDHFCIDEAMLAAAVPGVTGGHRAFGALWWIGSLPGEAWPRWCAAVRALHAAGPDLSVAASTLPHDIGVVIRVAARDGGGLDAALRSLLVMVAQDRDAEFAAGRAQVAAA